MADVELLIDVRQLPAGVFEEEFAVEGNGACRGQGT